MDLAVPFISEVGFPIASLFIPFTRIKAKLDVVVQLLQNLPKRIEE
ncbi:YvrJ family protein [Niallia sp. XMNu-256]